MRKKSRIPTIFTSYIFEEKLKSLKSPSHEIFCSPWFWTLQNTKSEYVFCSLNSIIQDVFEHFHDGPLRLLNRKFSIFLLVIFRLRFNFLYFTTVRFIRVSEQIYLIKCWQLRYIDIKIKVFFHIKLVIKYLL